MFLSNLLNDIKRYKIKYEILFSEEDKISLKLVDIHFVRIPIAQNLKKKNGLLNSIKRIFRKNNNSLKFEEFYLTMKLYDKLDEIIEKLRSNNIEIDQYDKITLHITIFVTIRNVYAVIFDYVSFKYENNKLDIQEHELENPIIIPISDFETRFILIKKLYQIAGLI